MADVNVPDGTQFTAGTAFTKTWRFANIGSTTWTKDYKLVYAGGNITGKNNTLEVNLPGSIKPGETLDISVNFVAPATNGSYSSKWSLYSASGAFFGEFCSITFNVGTTASTPVATATGLTTTTTTPVATTAATP
jgi:next-to-BRCA1 protein 1